MCFQDKRYKTQENYSNDGTAVEVNKRERSLLSQLLAKYDIFVNQKTTFLETFDNMMTLTCDLIVYKNLLDIHFNVRRFAATIIFETNHGFNVVLQEYFSNLISMYPNGFEPTTVSTPGQSKWTNL